MQKEAKKVMLEILIEFDLFCQKHELTYWLGYGTLLGAVRHQGFIPWDDDIDVCMPRDDYQRFLAIAQEELPDFLFLQTKESDPFSPVHYAKLRDRNSTYIDAWEEGKNIKYHQGIFIDIYPINFISHSKKNQYKNILYISKLFANRYVKIDLLAKWFIKYLNRFHHQEHSLAVLGAEGMSWDIQMNKDDIFPLKELKFATKVFPVPKQYKKHLEDLYGSDFMQLPDKKDRLKHSVAIYTNQKCEYEVRKKFRE